MNNQERIEMLLQLLRLPDGQNWVDVKALKEAALKADGST